MTVQEAIKLLEIQKPVVGCKEYKKPLMYAFEMAIKCMQEVEQYRALGTVEELKEAREKQVAKKVIVEDEGDSLLCPSCGLELMGSINDADHDPYYCFECGQKLDWEEGAE